MNTKNCKFCGCSLAGRRKGAEACSPTCRSAYSRGQDGPVICSQCLEPLRLGRDPGYRYLCSDQCIADAVADGRGEGRRPLKPDPYLVGRHPERWAAEVGSGFQHEIPEWRRCKCGGVGEDSSLLELWARAGDRPQASRVHRNVEPDPDRPMRRLRFKEGPGEPHGEGLTYGRQHQRTTLGDNDRELRRRLKLLYSRKGTRDRRYLGGMPQDPTAGSTNGYFGPGAQELWPGMHIGRGHDLPRGLHYRDYRDPITGDWLCLKCGKYTDPLLTAPRSHWHLFGGAIDREPVEAVYNLMRRNGTVDDIEDRPPPKEEFKVGGVYGRWDSVLEAWRDAQTYKMGQQRLTDERGRLRPALRVVDLRMRWSPVLRETASGSVGTRAVPAGVTVAKKPRNCQQCGAYLPKGKRGGRCSSCDETPLYIRRVLPRADDGLQQLGKLLTPEVPEWSWAKPPDAEITAVAEPLEAVA
jgi:hypothetical protein